MGIVVITEVVLGNIEVLVATLWQEVVVITGGRHCHCCQE